MLRRLVLVLLALVGAGYAGYRLWIRPWWRAWGVDPGESARALPGDEIVPDATATETRGITIESPPAAVWPWLVQMGFGRAGWYSYDALDMEGSSAERIIPELQDLKVGDVVPTHPGGGFEVKGLEPGRALVLYADTALMERQADAASAETPANLRAAGAFMENAQPTEYRGSWAFVLDELPDGGTRLVERVRFWFGSADDKPWTRYTLPFMGFGVFVMMRRQLLGLKLRAEAQPIAEPAEAAAPA